MKHNLRLIQLLLNLHNAVRLTRVLELDNVVLQLRQRARVLARRRVRKARPGVFSQELIDNLRQKLVRNERWVIAVRNDDTSHAFGPAVGVERVRLLLNVKSLAGVRTLRHRLAEQHHELIVAVTCESRKGAEVSFAAEFEGGFAVVSQDLGARVILVGVFFLKRYETYTDVEDLHGGSVGAVQP